MAQPPHSLTSILRAAVTQHGSLDLALAHATRAAQLRARRATASGSSASAPHSWRQLARAIPPSTPGYAAHAALYRQFLAAVAAALGDDASPHLVGDVSSAAFRAISAGRKADPSELPEREALARARAWLRGGKDGAAAPFGPRGPDDEAVRQMLRTQPALEAWLREHRGKAARPEGEAAAAAAAEAEVEAEGGVARAMPRAVEAYLAASRRLDMAAAAPPPAPAPPAAAAASGGDGADVSIAWLREVCRFHLETVGYGAEGVSPLAVDTLCASLLTELEGGKPDEQLQGELLEMLGYAAFDFVALVLPHRDALAAAARRLLAAAQGVEAERRAASGGAAPPAGSHGCAVSLACQSQKARAKEARKEQARAAREAKRAAHEETRPHAELEAEIGWLAAAGYAPAAAYVAAAGGGGGGGGGGSLARLREQASLGGVGKALPEGTVRRSTAEYEEVRVPPTPRDAGEDVRLVPISELPEYARPAFGGVARLNRLQSRVVGTALYSQENMLVCAPTGAGKTNVALLSMMQQVGTCMAGGVLQREQLKMVYIAPMKALAQELVGKFSRSLAPLGLQVREYTGDMNLSKRELLATQLIVTTPEKWDVVTRKGSDGLAASVGLLIIDEVHLLNDERGPVIEAIVARTLRLVESSQQMIRIVGLSATLPNYVDVALFLRVNPQTGLHQFGDAYRPVPLSQTFIGVKRASAQDQKAQMLLVAYERALRARRAGKQVMVFVHARNETVRTARAMLEKARAGGEALEWLPSDDTPRLRLQAKEVAKSRSAEVRELFDGGFGVHHAGMLRSDRTLTERLFADGLISVLVCTATLAWGVNLPAHTVIIKGTQLYSAEKGSFVDVGVLDVMQIFGRAGRPQFDSSGEGIIITAHAKLPHYLQMLTHRLPIESRFVSSLCDHLNAEISLGTVTSVREAVTWLSYTYLYVRMCRNPLAYGIPFDQKESDPRLYAWRTELVKSMAARLDAARMVRFHPPSGSLDATDLGRTAAHFYLTVGTIEAFEERLKPTASDGDVLHAVSCAAEFANIKQREEEMEEMDLLEAQCRLPVKAADSSAGKAGGEASVVKTQVLMQAYISNTPIRSFALVSDCMFIAQSAARISRGLFEIALARGWLSYAEKVLRLSKMFERRCWFMQHPLRQLGGLPEYIYEKLEAKRARVDTLRELTVKEVGELISSQRSAQAVKQEAAQMPQLDVEVRAQPITRTVLRVVLTLRAAFEWNDRHHGGGEPWWVWVEDTENEHIYYKEQWMLHKAHKDESQQLIFTIPLFEPLPPQYFVRAISDRWLGCETTVPLPLSDITLPHAAPAHTQLLDLRPLPLSALQCPAWEPLFSFTHFNPVQTQIFHTVYHTDQNVLVGAPTGSGKTVTAELAVLRMLRAHPGQKAVYIAPLKALVRERMSDWGRKFVGQLGYSLQELTGDLTPDMRALGAADILCTTPEKWDGVSRHWQQRGYVRKVGLVIIDEIHLLGEERGPILEVIVSRMRYISTHTQQPVRIVGLSTAMANAHDLADWLGIPQESLFNFKPSVRPVPLEVHIAGFPGKHYCPRMATMNKPTYRAILQHSPNKPVLVFVSSRRQTRLTALDLISYCSSDEKEHQFLRMPPREMEPLLDGVKDDALRHTLAFGVGIHHAGLAESDRSLVEKLFVEQSILVLVCTSTLAWGVNFPAHLVVIKGTEYYDGKTKRYVDFPVTDVLQMMGRAGRPQYDDQGIAVILVHEPKKTFYRKFLYEPFPVESCLQEQLHDHLNAEVVGGTITSRQDAVDFLSWTYFYRRLTRNPAYYHLDEASPDAVNEFLSDLIEGVIFDLQNAGCVELESEADVIRPSTLGRIASYYYLKYTSVALFNAELHDVDEAPTDIPTLLRILCDASEFDELPVRHNEEHVNLQLSDALPWRVDERTLDSPHTKANLLLQAHFARAALPMSDYITDTKSAMVDIAADGGWLHTALGIMHLSQMLVQARFLDDSQLQDLPHMSEAAEKALSAQGVVYLAQLILAGPNEVRRWLRGVMDDRQLGELQSVLRSLPSIQMDANVSSAKLAAGADAEVSISLTATNPSTRRFVHAPGFPKPLTQSGWWLAMGEGEELYALKRVHLERGSKKASLAFVAPDEPGEYTLDIFLVSDSYIGLDQRHSLTIHVAAK
ncbi:hypothetical protein AB1Y20_004002 [Prymnesium parvum]|uniref:U5 small nuclear ribonucleoprotein 200 kDa helicase n=1 Tax=Prymnesium parvum TaxID=97485 RepID=A0AB34J8I5_PRYPA